MRRISALWLTTLVFACEVTSSGAQELSDVAVIMSDAVPQMCVGSCVNRWAYDEGISREENKAYLKRPGNIQVIWGELRHDRWSAKSYGYVLDAANCIVAFRTHVDKEAPDLNKDIELTANSILNPRYRVAYRAAVPLISNSFEERRFFLNNISPDQIVVRRRLDGSAEFKFSASGDIYCRTYHMAYDENDSYVMREKTNCFKEFTAYVGAENVERFHSMVKTVYSKFCTGLKRQKDKF